MEFERKKKELHNEDPLIVRQAVTTLGELLVNPEKLIEAVKLNVVDRYVERIALVKISLRKCLPKSTSLSTRVRFYFDWSSGELYRSALPLEI